MEDFDIGCPKCTYDRIIRIHKKNMYYLAVPYSHPNPLIREERFKASNRAAGKLIKEGKLVFAPISHTHVIAKEHDLPLGWDYWNGYDQYMLSCCSHLVVLMLEGWEESIGVNIEIKLAKQLGLSITHISPGYIE